jgi:hypothetical protein
MGNMPLWLPALVLFNDYGGNWDDYLEAVYNHFKTDLVAQKAYYQGLPINLKRHPQFQDKEYVFWHVTSEGEIEDERIPDFRRCERIRWIKAIIDNASDPAIKIWENKRGSDRRTCLWLESEDYLVVLAKRSTFWLLWTAYLTNRDHTRRKLQREYEAYKRLVPPNES